MFTHPSPHLVLQLPLEGIGSERNESKGRCTWSCVLDALCATVHIQDQAGFPPQAAHVIATSDQRECLALSRLSGFQEENTGVQVFLVEKQLSPSLLVGRAVPYLGAG